MLRVRTENDAEAPSINRHRGDPKVKMIPADRGFLFPLLRLGRCLGGGEGVGSPLEGGLCIWKGSVRQDLNRRRSA